MATTTKRKSTSGLAQGDLRLARPLFTLREAAGYLSIPRSTLHEWARPGRHAAPLVTTSAAQGRQPTMPFIGFAEAYVLSAFRKAGVPMQRIRPAVETLVDSIGLEHALAAEQLYTGGAEVLYDYAYERGDGGLLELTVVRTGQRQFSELVRDYLRRIRYGSDGWATKVDLPAYGTAKVVVDPRRAFGIPLVVHGGARVEDLVDRFVAGDSVTDIAGPLHLRRLRGPSEAALAAGVNPRTILAWDARGCRARTSRHRVAAAAHPLQHGQSAG